MKKLWIAFALVMVVSFAVLGWIGTRIYQEAPPLVNKVVTTDGKVVIDEGEIQAGQNVWQSLGGMEVGSIWGHGSYVAPDWTADWLHREAIFILDRWANDEFGNEFEKLDDEQQAQLSGRLGDAHADQHLRSGDADGHDRPDCEPRPLSRTWPITRMCSQTAKPTMPFPPAP